MTKGHNQRFLNSKRSQFSVINDIMNAIVNDKKGHNSVKDSFAYKSHGILVVVSNTLDGFCEI